MNKKIAILGGGIIGLALAYKLSKQYLNYEIHLFEKESGLGKHQSGNNSGVLHCGLYYQPNTLKAKLAVDGIREMIKFCRDNEINHEVCGKVVVASNSKETKILLNLAERGKLNGLKGLKFLNKEELKRREPYVKANKALLVPEEGIVDYKMVMETLSVLIKKKGGIIHLNAMIDRVTVRDNGNLVISSAGNEFNFELLINCTGLHTDRTYKLLTSKKRPLRIIPFRGEYMNLKDPYKELVNHLVYPVPDAQYPFLGIHFTRMINGEREVGPNAVFAFKREGYKNTDFSVKDTIDSLTYTGFQKFIKNNFSFVMREFLSSLSVDSFIKKAQRMIPDIDKSMIKKGISGVRAQAMDNKGGLIMDFKIEKIGNQIHVLNAPSPGATASLAIADHIINKFVAL